MSRLAVSHSDALDMMLAGPSDRCGFTTQNKKPCECAKYALEGNRAAILAGFDVLDIEAAVQTLEHCYENDCEEHCLTPSAWFAARRVLHELYAAIESQP